MTEREYLESMGLDENQIQEQLDEDNYYRLISKKEKSMINHRLSDEYSEDDE